MKQLKTSAITHSELLKLKNVGPAALKDFHLLGITTLEQLAQEDPSELYTRLESLTNIHHDPCVWDVFAAAIHESKTGESLPWWAFTRIRKNNTSQLCHHTALKK